jgi:hypothetical protein
MEKLSSYLFSSEEETCNVISNLIQNTSTVSSQLYPFNSDIPSDDNNNLSAREEVQLHIIPSISSISPTSPICTPLLISLHSQAITVVIH